MKIDLYLPYRHYYLTNLCYPTVLDVLKLWAESAGWQARVYICKDSEVNLSGDAEVAGFSVYTHMAPAVYRLAEKLRQRGKIVVLGGPHFRGPGTYAEAFPYCDVLVDSISEQQWKGLLQAIAQEEIRANRQEPLLIVDREKRFRYPSNLFTMLQTHKWYRVPCVTTSVGCPYHCDFCSPYAQGHYFLRDLETICREVACIKGSIMVIGDATFGLNRGFTVDLMKAIAPLGKKIILETSLASLRDKEFVKTLAIGGVKWIMVGVETLTSRLTKHGGANLDGGLRDILDHAHDCGIMIQGNFVCGFDSDGRDSFDRIHECCSKSKFDATIINILTPYPNTPLYERLKAEGRIIDNNWEHYDKVHVVHRPNRMAVEQLIEGYLQLCQSLFSPKRIFQESFDQLITRGVTIESIAPIGYKMALLLDTWKKKTVLRHEQEHLVQATIEPGSRRR